MKVKDLIKRLQTANPESKVILSVDSEGNGYQKLADVQDMVFSFKDHEFWNDENENAGEPPEHYKPVVVLWP